MTAAAERTEDAIAALRRAASEGDPAAQTALGKRLLAGEGAPASGEKWVLSQWIRGRAA